ncbi:MAG: hypothetical protein AAF663_05900 [Planctomycetota bacterium]
MGTTQQHGGKRGGRDAFAVFCRWASLFVGLCFLAWFLGWIVDYAEVYAAMRGY